MKKIYFYKCNKFEKEISRKGYKDIIYKKLDELTQRNDLNNIGSIFNFRELLVLKTGASAKTIIQPISFENNTVYFVRAVIDQEDWVKSVSTQVKNNQWLLSNPLSEDEKQQGKETFLKELQIDGNNKSPFPPQELTSWFHDFKIKLGLEVYETETWVRYATNGTEQEGMREKDISLFHNLIYNLTQNHLVNFDLLKEDDYNKIWIVKDSKIAIIFTFIEENNQKYYLLYNGANLQTQNEYWRNTQEELKKSRSSIPNNLEQMRKTALRAYPSHPLKPRNSELWDKIQKSSENSNYSLLKEQIDFLEKFTFPTYINGQAGSGKSTMLYYIFANAYYLKCLSLIKQDIIFLTENENLLKITRTAIKDLLTNNSDFTLDFTKDFDNFDSHFASFKEFLLSLIPEDLKIKFPEEKYLNFSVFKNLYENSKINQNIKKKYSAEESWFAIVTYFKGYKNDFSITAENYENEVSRGARIFISKEKIAGIENNILPYYKKLIEEENYWDKLKIIDFIQKNLTIDKKFAVVICDEAQDFCRVELRFILHLCELVQYDLSEAEQVPIVFAGDPNQTVNPTGFRLDDMKTLMYQELREIAGFDLKREIIYNPIYNYRSSQSVVNLANRIQYYRKTIFGNQIESPQEAKRAELVEENHQQNVFLTFEAVLKNPKLIEKLQYKAFILPIDAQEKDEYTQINELFSKQLPDADMKTSVEAKGAEYNQVVLYGFGAYFLENFKNLDIDKIEYEEDFEKRYFFNKLYVGITRAKEELIIIDSEESKGHFWKKLTEQMTISNDKWKILNQSQEIILYDTDTILESNPKTALDNAREDKELGELENNPNRLKMAAKQFFRLNESNEQNICLALAEKIEGHLKSAAEYYAKTKNGMEASADCYWRGKYLKELITNITHLPSKEHLLRIEIAKISLDDNPNLSEAGLTILYQNKHLLRQLTEKITWRDELIDRLLIVGSKLEYKEQIRSFAEILLEIVETNDTKIYQTIGNLFFQIDDFGRAVSAWDNIEGSDTEINYIQAKIKIASYQAKFSDEIIWLGKLLEQQKFEEQKQTALSILNIYQTKQNELENHELSFILQVYKSSIITSIENENLLEIAQKTEIAFAQEQHILADFYGEILSKIKLNNELWDFILERWVKYASETKYKNQLSSLNEQYENWAKKDNKLFQAFTKEEISQISNLPVMIAKEPSEHFKEITIQNFRKFDTLELHNLGDFNLIVGDNNTGKTSLLEALTFTPNQNEFVKRLAFCFAERSQVLDFEKLDEDFWENFVTRNGSSPSLNFILKEGRNNWNYQFPNKPIDLKVLQGLKHEDSVQNPIVPFGKGFNHFLAQNYFDNIHKQGKTVRKEFLENMRVFIPEIETILADSLEILIEEKNVDSEGVSIYQYGDGANKMFRILLQMTLQKGKRIMIDEIDSGIHFSRFKKFWRILLKVAENNKIQIFATTHNLECIRYFAEVLEEKEMQELQNQARTITLYQTKDGNIKARIRTFEAFNEAIEEGYNIRGGE